MKEHIKNADIEKLVCFDFACKKPISDDMMRKLLSEHDQGETLEKYGRFKESKETDKDPLSRYCVKVGCGQVIKAENDSATKLTCPKCATEVCFKCRDAWHGEVSCADAMNK